MFTKEWGERYAIASCYNGLSIGGGGFTLPRMRLYECSLDAKSPEDFIQNVLPRYIDCNWNTWISGSGSSWRNPPSSKPISW